MALDEENQHTNNLRDKKSYLLVTHTILLTILSMVVWKQKYSTRKSIEENIIDNPTGKLRLIQDVREREGNIIQDVREREGNIIQDVREREGNIIQDVREWEGNIFEREFDSTLPLNRKQITNIKPSLAKITNGSEEYEILRNISYLLDQPNNSLSWHHSAEEQPFLQEILFRNKKQPYYVLLLNQSLKDIERFCTITLAPTSFCSILAIDTTFNIGRHYVTQTTYQNLSIFRKYTLKAPCAV